MDRKVAIITGAARGIGRECALRLSKDNIDVVINYNSSEEKAQELVALIKSTGGNAIAIKADVSKKSQVDYLFSETLKHFNRIDILVNNAGIVKDSLLMMLSESVLDECIDVNLKSYFYTSKQAALNMFKQKNGTIINLSSVSSIKAIPGQTIYSATKGAINSFTKVLAKELAPFGVTVNSIAPGFINTDMIKDIKENTKNEYLNMIPLKRFGETSEIAELVSFLCSDKVRYITGQIFVIDGGLSL